MFDLICLMCICKRVAYRNTGVRKSVAPSPRPLSPPRLAAIGIAPHKCAKYSSREYKLHHGCNFSRVTGPKGNFWGCYMTLLGLISQERNRNLNVASDVNCIRINYKPLLEMTLKITPFELPGMVLRLNKSRA